MYTCVYVYVYVMVLPFRKKAREVFGLLSFLVAS